MYMEIPEASFVKAELGRTQILRWYHSLSKINWATSYWASRVTLLRCKGCC